MRIEVAYDGSLFFGWQRQDGFPSVQQSIEEALDALLGDRITVHGSGRTDTGVHALRQVASFHVDTGLDDDRLRHALNAHVDQGIVLRRLETCRDDFHACNDARGKRYLYLTATTHFRPALGTEYRHWVSQPLDLDLMRAVARDIVGERDFRAFGNAGSVRKTTVRRVTAVRLVPRREALAIVVQANGFLYKMARTIAGTLLDVGRGRLDPGCVERALASGERSMLGATAPARGLYLLSVRYDEPVFRDGQRP